MSAPTRPTNSAFENPAERSVIATLIADVRRRYHDYWVGVSWLGTSDTRNLIPTPDPLIWGHRPSALESLAKNLALIENPSNSTVVYLDLSFEAPTAATRTSPTILPAWQIHIEGAHTHEEIVGLLRLFRLDAIADRLSYLHALADDDPDESPIEIESLRAMALFLMSERKLPDPQIGINPDGLMQIQWRVSSNGLLAMEFLSTRLIRFAAISEPARPGVERLSVNGTLPKDETLDAVQLFTSRL